MMRPDDLAQDAAFLEGGGELGALMRAYDWTKTPLGPPHAWPRSLKTAVRIMLTSRQPIWLGWGPELTYLYNDPYKSIIGGKHPRALGRPFSEVWREIWDVVGPMADRVMNHDEGTYVEAQLLIMERHGYQEETYYTFSYSPVPNDEGGPGGLICANTDDTARVIGERQLATLRELAARTANARTWQEACDLSRDALATNARDLPFAVVYVTGGDDHAPRLASATIGTEGLQDATRWPIEAVIRSNETQRLALGELAAGAPTGDWPRPPSHAAVLPIPATGSTGRAGALVVGLNPYRQLDEGYRGFLELVARQVSAAIANAEAYEQEKRRAEALAELDRAKTTFFSNVSHEFRTPLTLMLGPVEDILSKPKEGVLPENRALLEVVNRNGQRLLKLVNTLLDFARIEAGRAQASYVPTDLAALTADLASNFRAACERAGVRLTVDCPTIAEPAYVDREMWEKVVLNLVSNAFKFTLEGEIEVRTRIEGDRFVLAVRDTGSGIPHDSLPRMFERFYRVEGARGRSHEGSGIGLALVHELVKLHGGTIGVESAPGAGSTFTVKIPRGRAHLPPERVSAERATASTAVRPGAYVDEALSWLPQSQGSSAPASAAARTGQRIILADDNADLREYARKLLADLYEVEAVTDGEAALAAARRRRPDLVVSDVMMPKLDGFGLIRALRADAELAAVPVVLLSARAGEEARLEGLAHGADDYVAKPFSARELLVRVGALLQSAEARRKASEGVAQSEAFLRLVLDTAASGFYAVDEDGVTTTCNAAFVRMLGFARPEDAIGRKLHDVIHHTHPDGRHYPKEECPIYNTARRGKPAHVEDELFFRLDGTSFPVEYWTYPIVHDGEVRGAVTTFIDITERKATQEALRASEEQARKDKQLLEVALAASETGTFRFDFERSEFVDFDANLKRLFGFPEDRPVQSVDDFLAVVHPDDLPLVVQAVERTAREAVDFELEYRVVHRDGSIRWIFDRAKFARDAAGRPYLVGACTDVTKRKNSEEEARAVAEENARLVCDLREADRRKDEFLATLSHELRNPLAPLRNSLHLLRAAGASSPEASARVQEMMERQVDHLVRLVDDLLEVSRISRGTFELRRERVELAAVVRNALETSEPLIQAAGHRLSIDTPGEALWVDGDPVRLTQVVANLLNNAARYTDRGGHIEVSAWREGSEVAIRVKDNGMGISAEMLPRLFEMFSRDARSAARGGLGIGLALAKRLATMHGGTIAVASDGPGKGAEFTLRLPLAAAPAREPAVGLARSEGTVPRIRILVVDDNRDAADSMCLLLRTLGAEARVAHDGLEALRAYDAFEPAVVLLDIGMPGMDGYEVARQLRARDPDRRTRLVALTGWGQEQDRRKGREAGFDHHLVKPADIGTLQALLATPAATAAD